MELVLRFLALADASDEQVKNVGDIGEYLNVYMMDRAKAGNLADANQKQVFTEVFELLAATIQDNSFRRYDASTDRFRGGFLISAYEAIALGVAANLASWGALTEKKQRKQQVMEKVKALWKNQTFLDGIGSGKRASQRIPVTVNTGREYIKP